MVKRLPTKDLKELGEKTEFLWTINAFKDPFLEHEVAEPVESKLMENQCFDYFYFLPAPQLHVPKKDL